MPIPQLPDRTRPSTWQQGRYLEPGERETRWAIAGFAHYEVDAEGRVWHLAGPDAQGHRRRGREVKRQRKPAGSAGYGLRRNGCAVWVSVVELGLLLRQIERETG